MIGRALVRVLVTAAALLLIAQYIPGIAVASFYTALITALLWGLISLTIKPVVSLLTLPINMLTLGLFSFVVNALLFWFLSSFVEGFSVDGFLPALQGSLILTVVSWALDSVL